MTPYQVQEAYYSGYQHLHGEKFQSITYPNGLMGTVSKPFTGRASDARVMGASGVPAAWHQFLTPQGHLMSFMAT
jgi:hypothetical protein